MITQSSCHERENPASDVETSGGKRGFVSVDVVQLRTAAPKVTVPTSHVKHDRVPGHPECLSESRGSLILDAIGRHDEVDQSTLRPGIRFLHDATKGNQIAGSRTVSQQLMKDALLSGFVGRASHVPVMNRIKLIKIGCASNQAVIIVRQRTGPKVDVLCNAKRGRCQRCWCCLATLVEISDHRDEHSTVAVFGVLTITSQRLSPQAIQRQILVPNVLSILVQGLPAARGEGV